MNEQHFASVYDALMEDVPYNQWMIYTKKFLKERSRILDLACGTGTLAILLQKQGYVVQGADISQHMLTIAEEKVRNEKTLIPLFQQDMRTLEGFHDLDGVTLFCDGLNYLREEDDVQDTFSRVATALRTGGVFLFDVHTTYKMVNIFLDQLYGENGEDISYLWFCSPGEEKFSVEHSLTFFVKQANGSYERMDEELYQRTFPQEFYIHWLEKAGFHEIEVTSEFGESTPSETDERLFFKAVKK
ncbi:class I SAM-dependent methyltransferase [Evansella sp. AB-rgal1]|uniref:class I SAM-dependent DNA methyltransferase n=1 Tax=Evansella sp. AB-rgal1 TaxID=3242696 RepID=UPI00359E92C6